MNKSISVVMCTYNGERYVKEQIDSILRQTYPIHEVIIQDDCSTDKTYDILCEYQEKHSIIKVYRNQENKGINPNFFDALHKATGDYIAIADQDDIWEDYKLELQMQHIGDNLLCGGRSTPFSDSNAAIRVDNREINYSLLRQLFIGTMAGHTLLLSRKLLDKIPDISEFASIRYYDSILIIIALSYDSLIYLNHSLVKQRRYVEAATYSKPINNQKTFGNIVNSIVRQWKYNKSIKPEIRRRQGITLRFLNKIDSDEKILKDAKQMIQLYISTSFLDFIRLQWFCVCHYKQLFYARKQNPLIGRLRAIYFPISLSEYYRFHIK